jgi:triacylglycerol lipase
MWIWKPLLFLILTMTISQAAEHVILLHGLARTSHSMGKMEKALSAAGYKVSNISYPSRKYRVEDLAEIVKEKILAASNEEDTLHFVTHSMGGILVRYIQKHDPLENLGKVVMLSPPNQGSEVVDKLGDWKLFQWINGPAGSQLGTEDGGMVKSLGAVDFELGILTGDRSINLILSLMIPGKDDGKVSVENAKIEGMDDFLVLHAAHPFIMKNKTAIRQTIHFLHSGQFDTSESQ